jgi:O-acetylhomoserine/O-acetylserine sulfhydrylase-like pyridoxal-dependent enzyme
MKPILNANYLYDDSGENITSVELTHIGPDYEKVRIDNPTNEQLNEIHAQLMSQL